MRGAGAVLLCAAAALCGPRMLWAQAGPAPAPTTPALATTHVTYLAGGSVYLEAGRRDGLAEGDTLEVVSGGRTTSRLIVRYLSSARSACDTLSALRMPAVGDVVRYRAHAVAPTAASADTAGAAGAAIVTGPGAAGTGEAGAGTPGSAGAPGAGGMDGARRVDRLRGSIGVRYLTLDPRSGGGYAQPGIDLRLDGANVGGTPVDVGVDVRGRRTYHSTAGVADDGETRVYRLAAAVHDASGRRRLTVGRQLSSELASVSLLDGVRAEIVGERWGGGVFAGAEPDPATWAVNGDILHYGAFATRRGRQGPGRWLLTGGGVASFDQGQVNRQYGFLQGSWMDPRLSVFTAGEVDLNTGWKRTFGDPVVSLTNAFLSAHAQITRALSVSAGYDDRRNVRLYRDHETPETEFDDRHRQGAWLGAAAGVARYLRIAADGRWSGGGTGADYHSYSGSIEAYRLPPYRVDARWRSTRFDGAVSSGWMHTAGLGVRPWGTSRIELSGGSNTSTDALSGLRIRTRWEGVDLDLGIAPSWYLLLSAQHNNGDLAGMQWQGSMRRLF